MCVFYDLEVKDGAGFANLRVFQPLCVEVWYSTEYGTESDSKVWQLKM